jgi:hypothetical protein
MVSHKKYYLWLFFSVQDYCVVRLKASVSEIVSLKMGQSEYSDIGFAALYTHQQVVFHSFISF